MKEIINIILLILGFGAVLCASYFVTRYIGSKFSLSKGSKYIKILDRMFLANDKSICIIQIGGRIFILGITNHHIECIGDMLDTDLIPLSQGQGESFNNLFEFYTNKIRGYNKKNDNEVDRIQEIRESLDKKLLQRKSK